jgi:hypothetical protein
LGVQDWDVVCVEMQAQALAHYHDKFELQSKFPVVSLVPNPRQRVSSLACLLYPSLITATSAR